MTSNRMRLRASFGFAHTLLKTAVVAIALLFTHFAWAQHAVMVQAAYAVKHQITITLQAQVLEKISERSNRTERSYHLSLEFPEGVQPQISEGSTARVILPTIRNRETFARVLSISKNSIALLLANQVQQLDGQSLTVEIPLKPDDLFEIPFEAVYSPRGLKAEAFVLEPNSTVKLVPTKVLQVSNDGMVVVSSKQLKEAKVVIKGNDNLVSGDSVEVIDPGAGGNSHD